MVIAYFNIPSEFIGVALEHNEVVLAVKERIKNKSFKHNTRQAAENPNLDTSTLQQDWSDAIGFTHVQPSAIGYGCIPVESAVNDPVVGKYNDIEVEGNTIDLEDSNEGTVNPGNNNISNVKN